MLGVQIALAGLILLADFPGLSPGLWGAPAAPPAAVPVRPGDQTRRYSPADLPRTAPGGQPAKGPDFPAGSGVPDRLQFTQTTLDGTATLMLTGAIAPGDAARFADHLAEAASPPAQIALHSPGGSVSDALEIGRAIRAAGWPVTMQPGDACFSACPYILASGTERRVSRSALVGVHQHYFGENTLLPAFIAVQSIQQGQGEVLDYLSEMGIDLAVMARAMQTPPESIYILVEDELTGFRIATTLTD
jgi:hypothetical protein